VTRLAAQPAEKGTFQQLGIEPVCLRPAMLARYGDARWMDHVSFDTLPLQPPRQPETIAASFVGHCYPIDDTARLGRLGTPAIQQRKQYRGLGGKFLQRLAVDPWNDTGDQPA
jgi:hypothetical protein